MRRKRRRSTRIESGERVIIVPAPFKDGPNPEPTARQRVAVERMERGRADADDERFVLELIAECRRMVCPVTDPGRSRRRAAQCPKWCDLSAGHARAVRAREAALLARDAAIAKPYPLGDAARAAYGAVEAGAAGAADILEMEKLASACRADGCVVEEPDAIPACGVAACPGWCSVLERAWEGWWSL